MKIAIPVNEKNLDTIIAEKFGRCKYFLVYNTENNSNEYILNEGFNANGGAGIKAAQTIIDSKVDSLISYQLGENAIDLLKSVNISVFKPKNNLVQENLASLLNNELEKLF